MTFSVHKTLLDAKFNTTSRCHLIRETKTLAIQSHWPEASINVFQKGKICSLFMFNCVTCFSNNRRNLPFFHWWKTKNNRWVSSWRTNYRDLASYPISFCILHVLSFHAGSSCRNIDIWRTVLVGYPWMDAWTFLKCSSLCTSALSSANNNC